MRNFVRAALAFTFILFGPIAFAQTGPQLNNPTITGKLIAGGGPPPTGTGCTIAAGSTDLAGSCTASAAAGSIAFGTAFATAPICTVVDASATPVMVYTTTTAQITLTTITSTHVIYWQCFAKSGG